MNITKSKDAKALGVAAAELTAQKINEAIAQNGKARIILSTGASQFETLDALVKKAERMAKCRVLNLLS